MYRYINHKLYIFITILILLLVGTLAHAQDQPLPQHSDAFWQVSYWNNRFLSGTPVRQTTEAAINWDWGYGGPSGTNSDNFSARWQRYIDVAPGTYRFTATSDDGIRVYVDNRLIIDKWYDHAVQTFTADVSLSPGHHLIKVEYYENGGLAVAKLAWSPVDDIKNWRGEYYSNPMLSGAPVLVRDDQEIDFDWGARSPDAAVPMDRFSVRWTRTYDLASGPYRFTATSDDGIRVYVDGNRILDHWYDHAAQTFTADVTLTEGEHQITVEYYENGGLATAQVSWKHNPQTIYAWKGEYFNNSSLSGTPDLVRNDTDLNFDWGSGSPAPGINSDNFSVRWTRTLSFGPGSYDFIVTADDGVRLWINGHLLVDKWFDQASTTYVGTLYLPGGPVEIKMEYYENGGGAVAELSWQLEDGAPLPPAEGFVVDDMDSGFMKGGSLSGWRHVTDEGYNNYLTWTRNNDWERPNYNWARWYPSLAPGRYEVFVYIPDRYTTTGNARYWVSHRDGFTLRTVDQSAHGNRWVSLGTYRFYGNNNQNDYVSLSDVTYEPYQSHLVAFDAVKWEPR